MAQAVEDWYKQMPVITRSYLTAAIVTTIGCSLEIISPYNLYLNPNLVVKQYQVWRLITNFFYFRKMDLDFLFHMFFLARYCKLLEENSFRGRTADFFCMLFFGATVLTTIVLVGGMIPYVAESFAKIIFLSNSLTFMMVYVWSKQNPYIHMSFLGLFTFTAAYLPWVLLGFSVLVGASAWVDLLGMIAGHAYYFLEDVYPKMTGRRPLKTPLFIKTLFADESVVVARPAEDHAHNSSQMAPSFYVENSLFNFVVKDGYGVRGLVNLGLTEALSQYIQPPHQRDDRQNGAEILGNCMTNNLYKMTHEVENGMPTEKSTQKMVADEVLKHGNSEVVAKVYTFHDLAHATENFNPDLLIGKGGFGRVYKGHLRDKKQVVAVKQLDMIGVQGKNPEFLAEVLTLGRVHHPNLINLIGYCVNGHQRLLVYEYMKNGSLEEHLFELDEKKTSLDWYTRMMIAKGVAKGLEYLHNVADPPIIYGDLKSLNVLLDDDMNPKLSDFGPSKIRPKEGENHISTRMMETYGYSSPEYATTGELTTKSDVYSFGVVFLELISGRRVIDDKRPTDEQNLVIWAKPLLKEHSKIPMVADPLLNGNYPLKCLHQAVAIASMCLQEEASTRPYISDVVVALEYLATAQDDDHEPTNVDEELSSHE
ncbi:hypothetical protein E3N88_05218 [Mikania micrantha]|uniref:Protein kinase domain-containing protein n=1 Tax=Mikania micrantha TaxID=192012 RepID=A0A5N6PZF7_9ASTR|nr:hypothetical protein E3N88_05218 [Mikania micrantha]